MPASPHGERGAGRLTAGAGPHGVVIDASGDWAWVTNSYDNTVTAVNLPGLSATAPIGVGAQPSGISYSPRTPATAPADLITLDIPESRQADPHSGHHS